MKFRSKQSKQIEQLESAGLEDGEPRLPCALLVDVSDSMNNGSLAAVLKGLGLLRDELRKDLVAADRVELAVFAFNHSFHVAAPFRQARDFAVPELTAGGATALGAAVVAALDQIEKRRESYKRHAVDAHRPWLLCLSDGFPNDSEQDRALAKARVEAVETAARSADRIACFFVGIDESAMPGLAEVAYRQPRKLKDFHMAEMFRWVSQSLRQISQGEIGDKVRLDDPRGPGGWAEV
jgi:uncharacterized protein YegL